MVDYFFLTLFLSVSVYLCMSTIITNPDPKLRFLSLSVNLFFYLSGSLSVLLCHSFLPLSLFVSLCLSLSIFPFISLSLAVLRFLSHNWFCRDWKKAPALQWFSISEPQSGPELPVFVFFLVFFGAYFSSYKVVNYCIFNRGIWVRW